VLRLFEKFSMAKGQRTWFNSINSAKHLLRFNRFGDKAIFFAKLPGYLRRQICELGHVLIENEKSLAPNPQADTRLRTNIIVDRVPIGKGNLCNNHSLK
jgi:hypothetical protein